MWDEWPIREGQVRERHGDLRNICTIMSKLPGPSWSVVMSYVRF